MAYHYTIILILPVILQIEGSAFKYKGYTPLEINEVACTAEKLKVISNSITELRHLKTKISFIHK